MTHSANLHNQLSTAFTTLRSPTSQRWLRLLVSVCGVAIILYTLAQILWQIIPEPNAPRTVDSHVQRTLSPTQNTPTNNLSILLSQNVFGDVRAAPVTVAPTVTDAPETKLNLTLNGLVASTAEAAGAAIIARGNQQATYGIDDKIDGTQATLHAVYVDRVIISNRGVKETLMLDGVDFVAASEAQIITLDSEDRSENTSDNNSDNNNDDNAFGEAELDADMVAQLRSDPTRFADVIAINPALQNGEVIGYRVSPGSQPQFFAQAGLKAGDIITGLNGLDLTLPREAMRAMQTLQESDTLDVTILRNGDIQTLTLTLPGQ